MSKSRYSILVVDDSRDYRNLLAHYLSDLPCELVTAADGEDAVEACTERQFDLVIMDIIMPLMDGVDATEAIRRIEKETGRAPSPILAMSMEDSMETVRDCIRAGATRMIVKPSSKRDLLNSVTELLEFPQQTA